MSSADKAADVFQEHRDELGFVNRAQCREGDLVTIERDGRVVGAALGNHCVRKPQTTLYELAVLPECRRQGIASELVDRLADESPHKKIVAKCPVELPANEFYASDGWELIDTEAGKNRALNVWEREIIDAPELITTGRPHLTEIAESHGWIRGSRLDDIRRYENLDIDLGFIDIHWKDPDPDALLAAAKRHRPKYVVAGDYVKGNPRHAEINDRAAQLRPFAENVIVVPKTPGDLAHVPEWAVIGYSQPTDYGGTDIPVWSYRQADQPIHILGGTAHAQLETLAHLGRDCVQSVDTNTHHMAAMVWRDAWHDESPHWRSVESENAVEDAYRKSVRNVRAAHTAR